MKTNKITTYKLQSKWKLVILLVLMSVTGQSFGQSKNEVSLYLQGSFSKLDYEVFGKGSELKNGFGFGAGYAYYLSENWSIGTGAELQYIEGSVHLPVAQGSYGIQDLEGEDFEFRYSAEVFSENQFTYFLNIPLQIQYETSGVTRFYASGGMKAGLVLDSQHETEISSLVTSGYYPQYDVELTSPEFAGFGEFNTINSSRSELDLRTNYVLNLESGVKFMLENESSLYMGLFLDYGLNSIKPDVARDRLIGYNIQNPTVFSIGSVLSSRQDTTSRQYIDEVRTLAFGLKIGYAFQF